MTIEDMIKVAKIISTADGGCHHCIDDLIRRIEKEFPQFKLTLMDDYWIEKPEWEPDAEYGIPYPIICVEELPR